MKPKKYRPDHRLQQTHRRCGNAAVDRTHSAATRLCVHTRRYRLR